MPDPARRPFERASAQAGEGGFVLLLDGRGARTPGRHPLAVPTRDLGEAVAAEWNAQGPTVDPRTMPLTRLANSAIDGVAERAAEVRDDLVRYAGSDLVAYRAAEPERLVRAQADAWDPVLAWAREAHGLRFVLSEGVMFVAQPDETLAGARRLLDSEPSPFVLAALHVMTTLTGSLLIPLMHAAGRLPMEVAWRAAHIDETYQESVWGEDGEARLRRDARESEFGTASRFLRMARDG